MIRYDVSSLRPRIIIKIIIRNVSSGCNWESLREAKMIKQTLFEIERCISKRMQILPDECFGRRNNRYNDAY